MAFKTLSAPILLALVAPAAAVPAAPDGPAFEPFELAQLTLRERVIVRVRRLPPTSLSAPTVVTWKEKGGPDCIAVGDLAGALVTQPDAVDLVLAGGHRLRARLEGECRSLDFYSGFYLKQSSDGRVCAGRDTIRARSGATCPIKRFRKLVPQTPKR